jgi:hypothetical protein
MTSEIAACSDSPLFQAFRVAEATAEATECSRDKHTSGLEISQVIRWCLYENSGFVLVRNPKIKVLDVFCGIVLKPKEVSSKRVWVFELGRVNV